MVIHLFVWLIISKNNQKIIIYKFFIVKNRRYYTNTEGIPFLFLCTIYILIIIKTRFNNRLN